MYYPVPKGIKHYIIQDGNYSEWKNAFQAIDNYFCKDEGWKFQWSWKIEGVKNFMAGKCSDWISKS